MPEAVAVAAVDSPAPAERRRQDDLFRTDVTQLNELAALSPAARRFLADTQVAVICKEADATGRFQLRSTDTAPIEVPLDELLNQIVLPRLSGAEIASMAERSQAILEAHGVTRRQAGLLALRGFSVGEELTNFLQPKIDRLMPREPLKGLEKALPMLIDAVEHRKRIAICADYDADGNCASAVFGRTLDALGVDWEVFQPDRLTQGYGLHRSMVEDIARQRFDILVTLDYGISNEAEIAHARELGLKTIVVDHHEIVPERLARPDALIDPMQPDCGFAEGKLCATALAWKVGSTLRNELIEHADSDIRDRAWRLNMRMLLPFVAIATIADQMSLSPLNRALVTEGLQELRITKLVGLRQLAGKLAVAQLDSDFAGFLAGPVLNACGRILEGKAYGRPGTAPVRDLLLTDDPELAAELAAVVVKVNDERKNIERIGLERADREVREKFQRHGRLPSGLVITLDDGHEGVAGLLAARFQEWLGCPVVVLVKKAGYWKGSGRSIPGVHMVDLLGECAPHLASYGGHEMAAGMTLHGGDWHLRSFIGKFELAAEVRMSGVNQVRERRPDFVMSLREVLEGGASMVAELAVVEPHGRQSFPATILIPNVRVTRAQLLSGQHLTVEISQDGTSVQAFCFHRLRLPALAADVGGLFDAHKGLVPQRHEDVDIICRPMVDRWRQVRPGREIKLQIVHAQLAKRSWTGDESAAPNYPEMRMFEDLLNPAPVQPACTEQPRPRAPRRPHVGRLMLHEIEQDLPLTTEHRSGVAVKGHNYVGPIEKAPVVAVPESVEEYCTRYGIDCLRPEAFRYDAKQMRFVVEEIERERAQRAAGQVPTGALLEAPTGAGKTVVDLLYAGYKNSRGERVLGVTWQGTLVAQFQREINKFMKLEDGQVVGITHEVPEEERKALYSGKALFFVGTPEILEKDRQRGWWTFKPRSQDLLTEPLPQFTRFSLVIFDEAQFLRGKGPYTPLVDAFRREQLRGAADGKILLQSALIGETSAQIAGREAAALAGRTVELDIKINRRMIQLKTVELTEQQTYHLGLIRQAAEKCAARLDRHFDETIQCILNYGKGCRFGEAQLADQLAKMTRQTKSGPFSIPSKKAFGAYSENLQRIKALWEGEAKGGDALARRIVGNLGWAISLNTELGHLTHLHGTLESMGRFATLQFATQALWNAAFPGSQRRKTAEEFPEPLRKTAWQVRTYTNSSVREVIRTLANGTPYAEVLRVFGERYLVAERSHRNSSTVLERAFPGVDFSGLGPFERRKRFFEEARGWMARDKEPDHPKEQYFMKMLARRRNDRMLVRVPETEYGKYLTERVNHLFGEGGRKAVWIAGRKGMPTKELDAALKAFDSGAANMLIGTSVMDYGHDIKNTFRLVLMAPEMSPEVLRQLAGRVARQVSMLKGVVLMLASEFAEEEGRETQDMLRTYVRAARARRLNRERPGRAL